MNAVREVFLDSPSECLGERRIPPDVRPSVSGLRTSTPFRHQIVQLQSCQTGTGPELVALWYNWGISLSQSRSQAPNTQSAPSAPFFNLAQKLSAMSEGMVAKGDVVYVLGILLLSPALLSYSLHHCLCFSSTLSLSCGVLFPRREINVLFNLWGYNNSIPRCPKCILKYYLSLYFNWIG